MADPHMTWLRLQMLLQHFAGSPPAADQSPGMRLVLHQRLRAGWRPRNGELLNFALAYERLASPHAAA